MAVRCLQEPACKAAFAAKVHQANDLFEALDLASEAERIQAQIAADIASDPKKEVTTERARQAHVSLVDFIRARPAAVRARLAAHGF